VVPERTRLIGFYGFRCDCEQFFHLGNVSYLIEKAMAVSRRTLSALPGLGVMMAMTSKGLDMVT
jgi:hypothetical protein